MNKTLVVILVLVTVFLMIGGQIVSNSLENFANRRLDSSEAILTNEVDARIYKDFHLPTPPTEIEISLESLKYRIYDNVIRLRNNGENLVMEIEYSNGDRWEGKFKGNVEVQSVDIINIDNKIKVDLKNTNTRVIAITYKNFEDFQRHRVSMNRDFTRYLILEYREGGM